MSSSPTDPPLWRHAPAWAEWLAMDRRGRWHWFQAQPWCSKKDGIWFTRRHFAKLAAGQVDEPEKHGLDWATTKQRRPEEAC